VLLQRVKAGAAVKSGCSVEDGTPDGGTIAGDTFTFEVSQMPGQWCRSEFQP